MDRIKQGAYIIITGAVMVAAGVLLTVNGVRHLIINLIIIMGGILIFSGGLMLLFSLPRRRKIQPGSEMEEIDLMDGHEFEDYLTLLFTGLGYIVHNVKKSRDFGADLILETESLKIVVQAKRYQSKVPLNAVQECAAARAHYKSDDAWLITNNYFTQPCYDLALSNNVKLINRNGLADLIEKARAGKTAV